MKPALLAMLALAGCTAAQLQSAAKSPAGQLFCAIQTAGGGAIVVGLINAEASAVVPAAAPVAILATNVSKAFVDSACAAAGGIAVSPPVNPAAAPQVAVSVAALK
jgi:hypothetical protein